MTSFQFHCLLKKTKWINTHLIHHCSCNSVVLLLLHYSLGIFHIGLDKHWILLLYCHIRNSDKCLLNLRRIFHIRWYSCCTCQRYCNHNSGKNCPFYYQVDRWNTGKGFYQNGHFHRRKRIVASSLKNSRDIHGNIYSTRCYNRNSFQCKYNLDRSRHLDIFWHRCKYLSHCHIVVALRKCNLRSSSDISDAQSPQQLSTQFQSLRFLSAIENFQMMKTIWKWIREEWTYHCICIYNIWYCWRSNEN